MGKFLLFADRHYCVDPLRNVGGSLMPENILLDDDDDDDVLQERHVSGEELEKPRYDPSAEPSCGETKARLDFNLQLHEFVLCNHSRRHGGVQDSW